MKLITGKKGEAHVTSLQHRNIIGAVVGDGSYIAQLYNKLAPSISGNVLSIGSGVLIHHGCAMQVDYGTTDTVQLTAGTAGYYRGDYVVARWTQNSSTGIESAEWVLIQGTPTTSRNVTWPTYNSGNMQEGALIDDCPVFAIYYNGVTPEVTKVPAELQTAHEIETVQEVLSNMVMTTSYTLTGMAATLTPGDNTVTIQFDSVPSGEYTPVGIVGVQTSGTGSASVRLRAFGVSSGGTSAFVKVRNEASSDITPSIGVTVLWIKTDVLGG